MLVLRTAANAAGLWVAGGVVGGVRIGAGAGAPALIGTLVLVTLGYHLARAMTTPLRYRVWALCRGPMAAVTASLLLNGLLLWATALLADLVGLPVHISGPLPALCVSLLTPALAGLLLTAARGPIGHP